jgi:hypothetical protein
MEDDPIREPTETDPEKNPGRTWPRDSVMADVTVGACTCAGGHGSWQVPTASPRETARLLIDGECDDPPCYGRLSRGSQSGVAAVSS